MTSAPLAASYLSSVFVCSSAISGFSSLGWCQHASPNPKAKHTCRCKAEQARKINSSAGICHRVGCYCTAVTTARPGGLQSTHCCCSPNTGFPAASTTPPIYMFQRLSAVTTHFRVQNVAFCSLERKPGVPNLPSNLIAGVDPEDAALVQPQPGKVVGVRAPAGSAMLFFFVVVVAIPPIVAFRVQTCSSQGGSVWQGEGGGWGNPQNSGGTLLRFIQTPISTVIKNRWRMTVKMKLQYG